MLSVSSEFLASYAPIFFDDFVKIVEKNRGGNILRAVYVKFCSLISVPVMDGHTFTKTLILGMD